jgi:hypothetical protein
MVVKRNESAEGAQVFLMVKVSGRFVEHAAKNVDRGAECKGVDGVCEFRHGFFLSVVVVDGEEKAGRIACACPKVLFVRGGSARSGAETVNERTSGRDTKGAAGKLSLKSDNNHGKRGKAKSRRSVLGRTSALMGSADGLAID